MRRAIVFLVSITLTAGCIYAWRRSMRVDDLIVLVDGRGLAYSVSTHRHGFAVGWGDAGWLDDEWTGHGRSRRSTFPTGL